MTPLSLFLFLSTLLILPLSAEQAVTYPSTKKWDYIGCYNETSPQEIGPRILSGGIDEALPGMTVPMCLAFCFSNFFKFAGVEYAQECYCSDFFSLKNMPVREELCDMPCVGNGSLICGGALHVNVYQTKGGRRNAAAVQEKGFRGRWGCWLALGVALAVAVGGAV